jgi:hypothetical protein
MDGSKSGKKSKRMSKSIPYNYSPELAIDQDVVFVKIKDFENAKAFIKLSLPDLFSLPRNYHLFLF